MNSEVELDSIIEVISRANKIGIFTHISPDGDAIGSSLAFYLGLLQLKKNVEIVTDEFSKCFSFLNTFSIPGEETSKKYCSFM